MTDDRGRDHTDIAAEAEREADDLEHQGDKLEKDIEASRSDWERKQEDPSVPGAVPEEDDESAQDAD